MERASGILLHPISLPGEYGIGEIGSEAFDFVDFLIKCKQKLWQVLPLNPVGYGESPYQSFSAFAGNPLLISINKLYEEGLLSKEDLKETPCFNEKKVEYSKVRKYKEKLFRKAFTKFIIYNKNSKYISFKEENCIWLENYSSFMALKKKFKGLAWNYWDKAIAIRDEQAIQHYKKILNDELEYHNFLQFVFYTQWIELKEYAKARGIKIIGDLPIFISYDSSDVWANPTLFELDQEGNPLKIAGVPPDYFSKTGQVWGNPHYKWEEMRKNNYKWWRERFKALEKIVDIIRIDHFRGFEAYWEIPAGEETAVNGRWVKGPGEHFFSIIEKYLGKLPIIAEDLGYITSQVELLKKRFNFPGMKVLQFIFEDETQDIELPLELNKNSVVYTGTHDNDTSWGWFKKHVKENSKAVQRIIDILQLNSNFSRQEFCWRFIEVALQSTAKIAIIPLQDILCLDSSARMNFPGTLGGNWQWRFGKESLTKEIEEKLSYQVENYNR